MKRSRLRTILLFGLIGIALMVVAARPAAGMAQAGIAWAGKAMLRQQLEQHGLHIPAPDPGQIQQQAQQQIEQHSTTQDPGQLRQHLEQQVQQQLEQHGLHLPAKDLLQGEQLAAGGSKESEFIIRSSGSSGMRVTGNCTADTGGGSVSKEINGNVGSDYRLTGRSISCRLQKADQDGELRVTISRDGEVLADSVSSGGSGLLTIMAQ
ncbi:hypothetical protein [Nitrolancea hollandica]|uniref:Uncharacterized protein n=1 Tax=Nitrolancea hollandica Lb TaxID=1129897 RepID=I4EEE2_9BACT|nr:hypothetical protein [Nitrolancea hollandica]CCF83054.1 exported hypothetical protein [Nitrolancea hollandica Lb]